jgi:hypothetical protein
MSISDSSAVGLVLSKAETAQIATSGEVTFGGTSVGTIELAGSAGTAFGYDTLFLSGSGIRINSNIDSTGSNMEWAAPVTFSGPLTIKAAELVSDGNVTFQGGGQSSIQADSFSVSGNLQLGSNVVLRAENFLWGGVSAGGTGQTMTVFVPEIDFAATVGSSISIQPNLVFGANSTLSAVGRNPIFSGTLSSLHGTEQVVLAGGDSGNFSFLNPVGAGAGIFGNLLVQGNQVTIGPGASLRSKTLTVDVNTLNNQAGAGALVSTTGRTLLFSDNPNNNSPTGYNAGVSGLSPMFDQTFRIQLTGPGAYSVQGSLPGGSLAVYGAQLADVLPADDLTQFADQQAYLAAVPVTAFQLPVPDLNAIAIHQNDMDQAPKVRVHEPIAPVLKKDLGLVSPPSLRKAGQVRSGVSIRASLDLRPFPKAGYTGASYSQYSQGFDSLSQ